MEAAPSSHEPRPSIWPRAAAIAAGVAFLIVVAKLLAPATAAPIQYKPETFRQNIANLIVAKRYDRAVRLLGAADVEAQVTYDLSAGAPSYLMVAEDLIVTPGIVDERVPNGWVFPGTSDVIYDDAWQDAATDFAKRYNLALKARLDKVNPAKP